MSKLHIPLPAVMPATLSRAQARHAIEQVVNGLLAKKTSSLPSVRVGVSLPGEEEPSFIIKFAYQRDPIHGARLSGLGIRHAKKGANLSEKFPKIKFVSLPAEAKPEPATPAAPAEPKAKATPKASKPKKGK